MSTERFQNFFRLARGDGQDPFDYQTRLACGDDGQGRACASLLVDVPTGCGKTAAVVLAWLWNRVAHPDPAHRAKWPRRLVYCLPMRSLVEQTHRETQQWLVNSGHADQVGLHVLMGGAEDHARDEWDLYPGRDAILIGTQDMLLSRALNRGYGLNRFRWPMAFGLLNTDCLWIFDETQLLGVGVETSAQLDGFRHLTELGTPTGTFTWWMSATLDPAQLATVDHQAPSEGWPTLRLETPDLQPGSPVQTRRDAVKRFASAPFVLNPGDKGDYAKNLAAFIREKHQPGTLTLVVLNRVARARAVYLALQKAGVPDENLALVHSRFRPDDRQRHKELLLADGTDRIVIATQAVEAGIDVSARVLVTELAPWPSLVQRFGRCNRRGEWPGGTDVFWIDVRPKDDKDDLRFPYPFDEFDTARNLLAPLSDVGISTLKTVIYETPPVVRSVIRRKDLLDLFDTTADLLGHDLDISRYVRDSEDTDVQVFWREVPANDKIPDDEPDEIRRELCRVSLADMGRFLKKKPRAFVWKTLEGEWHKAGEKPRPGEVYLVALDAGGYDDRLGWTGDPPAKTAVLTLFTPPRGNPPPRYDGNDPSFIKRWIPLADHTAHVRAMLDEVLPHTLPLSDTETNALREAALWHDVGKAHKVFQDLLQKATDPSDPGQACPDQDALWAKSGGTARSFPARKGFRHELASALAWLQHAPDNAAHRDLSAFLIAAHHGRVRLSIRSLPDESPRPTDPERLYARGIWDRDPLPGDPLASIMLDGLTLSRMELDLGYMQMGDRPGHGPSWLARMLALRDSEHFGPFRLAYLETLLRAADQRASAREATQP